MGTHLAKNRPLTTTRASTSTDYDQDENDSRWNFRLEVTAAATEFVPVRLVGDASATPTAELTLVLSDGLRLEIGRECRAETLKRVLGVLQERA